MGAWGGLIMGFFGGVFASLTMYWHWHVSGALLAAPFLVFAVIAVLAARVIRQDGPGMAPSPRVKKAFIWSSTAEGLGLFIASNVVINLQRPEWLLPAMALVVGLHFVPIALAAAFRPFLLLGAALILAAIAGFLVPQPLGGEIAGLMAAAALWIASLLAIKRDRLNRAGGLSQ